MEPETPPQNTPSVSAAGTQKPSASNPKTSGAFGKAKALKRMSDYFPAPFRKAKRQHTFAANAVPPEPETEDERLERFIADEHSAKAAEEDGWKADAWQKHIAKEQGWEKK